MELPPYEINGKYKIENQFLFPTALFQIELDDVDNNILTENAYKLYAEDRGIKVSNSGGWHSDFCNFHDKNFKYFEPLTSKFQYILPELPLYPNISKINQMNIWFNLNRRNNIHKRHHHINSDFSGVYYVKVPKEVETEEKEQFIGIDNKMTSIPKKDDCGKIKFFDPRQAISYGNYFYMSRYHRTFDISRMPIEGTMFIFPSGLEHEVLPNSTDEDRISISFNLIVE